ncbi:GntR family transcriptional regulator [Nonomuraea typhae]|uniref:GntR family transcriptional regulator n=1 Tax=Nonomuraea typhae TaxID=2603600 RepID=UPI0012FAC095|nr:GntR family transcriptional regulator [Nonomuraea typhae]
MAKDDEGREGAPDLPLWQMIRDEFMTEIDSGQRYPAGALLPSVREMRVRWTVSTTTARRVMQELVAAGYARTDSTRGHVSNGPQRSISQSSDSATTSDDGSSLGIPSVRVVGPSGGSHSDTATVHVRIEPALPEAALALRLGDLSTPVVTRRRLSIDADGIPVQLKTSYLAPGVGENTPLVEPVAIDREWREALAAHAHRDLLPVDGYIQARHPSDNEARVLKISQTACVLVRAELTRDKESNPVDFTVTVWPGDSTRLALA